MDARFVQYSCGLLRCYGYSQAFFRGLMTAEITEETQRAQRKAKAEQKKTGTGARGQNGRPLLRKKREGWGRPTFVLPTQQADSDCPIPPSTLISTPVTYDASWEARNATTPATSSGCPKRFIGTFDTTSFAN